MKLQTKKIVAKEFLILTITVLLGLLGFWGTYTYNYFKKIKIEKLNESITEKKNIADSLISSYSTKSWKQNWFFEKHIEKANGKQTKYNTANKLWKRLNYLSEKDSIKYKWDKVWDKKLISSLKEIGFSNGDKFNSFIVSNRITKIDYENYNQYKELHKQINGLKLEKEGTRNSILSFKERVAFGLNIFAITAIILMGMRYLYYAIRWSIWILKQKDE